MKNIYLLLALISWFSASLSAQTRIYSPALRAPANNATGQMPDVLLDWDAVTGQGFVVTYEVQLARNADFSDAITFPPVTVTALQMNELLFNTVYYWRVRASDGTLTSDWSEPFSFRVTNSVSITGPANQSNQMPNPLITWSPLTGVTQYEMQVDTAYSWANMVSGVTAQLNDVFELSANQAWAVGNGGTILQYNGTSWTPLTSGTTQNLNDVFFVDANNGWAVGQAGTILYFNGTAWAPQTSGVTANLNGVFFTSATNGYAVGASATVLRWDGNSWSPVSSGITGNVTLNAIHGLDANNIWIAGTAGNFSYFNGTSWSNGIIANREITGLWALAPDKIWASARAGRIFYFNGQSWAEQASGSTRDLWDVCMLSENNGFIVGSNGTLIQFNGTEWGVIASGTTQNLNGIYLMDANTGFIVGNSGAIIKFQGEGFNSPYLKSFPLSASLSELRLANLAFGANHYVRMRASHAQSTSDWSSPRSFFVNASPTLTSPANNATNIALDTLVRWSAMTGIVNYTIQRSLTPDFADPFTFESSTNEYRFQGMSFGRDYYWRVRARHAGGNSFWSPVFKFTTASTVTPTAPANNATNVIRLPRFQWQHIRGTEKYQLQFGTSNTFDPAVTNTQMPTSSSFQTVFLLAPQTTYFWRVRGIQGLDTTNWSQTFSFVTTSETSIGENPSASIRIHPNPGQGLFTISAPGMVGTIELEVYNLVGKRVYHQPAIENSLLENQRFDLRNLGKGVYLLKLQSSTGQSATRKLMIE
ncbi:MAG: T9SS type A sorting domain-containing protein [Bacteroidetes bacterium]|nr:T9SS type A sorting domain-containing protein [Bacteroidota bacterium]